MIVLGLGGCVISLCHGHVPNHELAAVAREIKIGTFRRALCYLATCLQICLANLNLHALLIRHVVKVTLDSRSC